MSIIINPNASPRRQGKSALDEVLRTMGIIAIYREQYFKLTAQMQGDGVKEITAREITDLDNQRTSVIRDMVQFILSGESIHGRNASNSQRITAPLEASTKDNAQESKKPIYTGSAERDE